MVNAYSANRMGDFVGEGILLALPLCFPGQSVPPPAGETAMTTMTPDARSNAVYMGTAGAVARVMVGVTHQDTGIVHDLGVIEGAQRVDAIGLRGKHVYIVATGPGGTGIWSTWRAAATGFLIQEWGISRFPYAKVCDVLGGRKVAGALFSADGDTLYGLTEGEGEFFKMDLAAAAPSATIVGKVDPEGEPPFFSTRMVRDGSGNIWGTSNSGFLWKYDIAENKLTPWQGLVASAAGRSAHTTVTAWALDAVTGMIYGGTSPDGYFFKLDPRSGEMTPLGKPCRLEEIHCLTVANDGRVFGMGGAADDIGHMFCYDPKRGALYDMGVPASTLTQRQYGYHFRCAATGGQGELYFGQHERVNFLWMYFPVVAVSR